MFGVPRPRKSKAPLPSGVRSVSPITTVVMASNGAFSSSATICLYAVNVVLWPKSLLPVRIRMVLSG